MELSEDEQKWLLIRHLNDSIDLLKELRINISLDVLISIKKSLELDFDKVNQNWRECI